MSKVRLIKEYTAICNLSFRLFNVNILPESKDKRLGQVWELFIKGPKYTPHEGGVFKIILRIPTDYPFKAPWVDCEPKNLLHPCINSSGNMSMPLLWEEWSPAFLIVTVAFKVLDWIEFPQENFPANSDVHALYSNNNEEYVKLVQDHTANNNPNYSFSLHPTIVGETQPKEPFQFMLLPKDSIKCIIEYVAPYTILALMKTCTTIRKMSYECSTKEWKFFVALTFRRYYLDDPFLKFLERLVTIGNAKWVNLNLENKTSLSLDQRNRKLEQQILIGQRYAPYNTMKWCYFEQDKLVAELTFKEIEFMRIRSTNKMCE